MSVVFGDPAANLGKEFVLPTIFTHENYEDPTMPPNNIITGFTSILPILLIIVLIRKKEKKKKP